MPKTDEEIVLFESVFGTSFIMYRSGNCGRYKVDFMPEDKTEWLTFDNCPNAPYDMIYPTDIIHIDER